MRRAMSAHRLAVLAFLAASCGGPARPRNLLVVCVDTLRVDELGAYGQRPTRTPALDRLAEESVVFERAHAAASWTLPSVGAVFTSCFPSTTGLWTFESRLSDSFPTLAERFQAAGFDTHGVASHVFFDREYGLQQGFESFDDELCRWSGEEGWEPITAPAVSAKAVRWLQERVASGRDRPWLLFVHFFDPHLDYLDHEAADPAASARPERERYRSEIAFTDRHVGELLAALERSGLAEETNVLFFSDHGESFFEHPGIRRHSYSLYEEELRVPLFLRVPGLAPRRVADHVRAVDLFPTLLELFGLADEDARLREGMSLLPLLEGEARSAPAHLAEIRLKAGHHANALVRGRYKLYEDVSNGRLRLFDLAADPGEQRDLSAEQPALLAELEDELRALVRAAEEKGARFAAGGKVEHTLEELEHLRSLGYAASDDEPAAPIPAPRLDDVPQGALPADWRIDATKPAAVNATWEVRSDPSAPGAARVLALTRTNHGSSSTFNLCWSPSLAFRDGSIQAAVRADSGAEDQGGGLAWRIRDRDNYYLCRYNPLERNFRVYVVKDGERRQLASAQADVPAGTWFRLHVEHVGTRITCALDGAANLSVEDASLPGAGGIGLWTKADACSSFAALEVRRARD